MDSSSAAGGDGDRMDAAALDDSAGGAESRSDAESRGDDATAVVGPEQYPAWLMWAKSLGGRVTHMAALPDGSFMLTGCSTEDDIFDEAATDENITLSSSATMFVARYGPEGELLWVKEAQSEDGVCGGRIAVLPDGSCAVNGYLGGTAVFGKGEPEETELTGPASYSGAFPQRATFVSRYDPQGALQWAERLGELEAGRGARPEDVAILADGSVVVVGSFNGTAVFAEGGPNQTELTAEDDHTDSRQLGYDIFLVKYGPKGALEWAKQAGGLQTDEGHGISALADGSFLVTGMFTGVATFGDGEADEVVLRAPGTRTLGVVNGPITPNEPITDYNSDIFVAKYRPDGTVVWARSAGSDFVFYHTFPYQDAGQDIAALPDGSSVVTGSFGDVAIFGKGEPNETELTAQRHPGDEGHDFVDIFVAKYDSEGLLEWARSVGNPYEAERANSDMGYGVGVASDGSCFATGAIGGEPTFGGRRLDRAETPGVFVAKYSAAGVLDAAVTFGQDSSYDVGRVVAPLSDGSVLVMGRYAGPFIVDGKKVFETQKSEESHDYIMKKFVLKLRL